MKFTLEIDCDNAAFGDSEDERHTEVARILTGLADQIEHGYIKAQLYDANGNAVGVASFVDDGA